MGPHGIGRRAGVAVPDGVRDVLMLLQRRRPAKLAARREEPRAPQPRIVFGVRVDKRGIAAGGDDACLLYTSDAADE